MGLSLPHYIVTFGFLIACGILFFISLNLGVCNSPWHPTSCGCVWKWVPYFPNGSKWPFHRESAWRLWWKPSDFGVFFWIFRQGIKAMSSSLWFRARQRYQRAAGRRSAKCSRNWLPWAWRRSRRLRGRGVLCWIPTNKHRKSWEDYMGIINDYNWWLMIIDYWWNTIFHGND